VTRTLLLAVALLSVLRIRSAFVKGGGEGFARRLAAIRTMSGVAAVALAALALTIYAATILYGWIAEYALPTVAVFDIFPAMQRLALWEPNAPNALYFLAGVCAIFDWLIRLMNRRAKTERSESVGTLYAGRLGLLFGAIFLVVLFVMSNGGWRGVNNPADMKYISIAGVVPYSDAADYFFSAADLSLNGRWDEVASQRPVAAAIRTGIVAVAGTYVASLVLQAALLAICASFAILGVAEILGSWSAMAFAGLLFGLERPYVTSTMTETLGLSAVVLSAPFVLRALRDQSYKPALAAFGLVTAAMLIRMGSMFTLPFLAAWVVFLGVRAGAGRAALVGVALVVAGLWFGQWTLFRQFGDAQLGIGGDFSYILCGLTNGTDWEHCQSEALGKVSTQSIATVAFEMGWQGFLADPWVMASSLVRNGTNYVVELPSLLFRQYANVASISFEWIVLGVTAPILVVVARFRTLFYANALSFFVLFFLTTVASAAMIFSADGRRTLIVTNVLLALGLALGFALPDTPGPAASAAPGGRGLYLVPLVLLLVFGLPALVRNRVLYRMTPEDRIADTMRLGAAPAVLVTPGGSIADRHQMSVSSELLRQTARDVDVDPKFSEALAYGATNAPGVLLAPRPYPMGALYLLFGKPGMIESPQRDVRIRFTRMNKLLYRVDRWWPGPGQDSVR
jgi:hypothetical protein